MNVITTHTLADLEQCQVHGCLGVLRAVVSALLDRPLQELQGGSTVKVKVKVKSQHPVPSASQPPPCQPSSPLGRTHWVSRLALGKRQHQRSTVQSPARVHSLVDVQQQCAVCRAAAASVC